MNQVSTQPHAQTIDLSRTATLPRHGLLDSLVAELFVLRHRAGYWVLLALWTAVGSIFGYVVPYLTWRNNPGTGQANFDALLPSELVSNVVGGFPFYGGAVALILGVLAVGSDYSWGTFKTLLTQRSGRFTMFGAKLLALAVALIPFVLSIFVVGAGASAFIASREGVTSSWPSLVELGQGLLASWFILAIWAGFGVMLAVLSRGTSLAIGIGILYTLAIEGLLSALTSQISVLDSLVQFFVRANAYSLIQSFGGITETGGPGSFSGPFVGTTQALIVLTIYLLAFVGISAFVIQRRDIDH